MQYKYKIRIVLWLLFAGFLAFLLNNKIVPIGHISYFSDFNNKNYFISKITPAERIYKKDKKTPTEIIGDPVYFTLHAPRKFKQVKLTMDFQVTDDTVQDIQAGVLKDKTIWRYELKPLYNRSLENLSTKWNVINENGLILLQKEKKFESINLFLKNLPTKKEIALYNYNLPNNFKIFNYSPLKQERIYPLKLRGPYEFYFYIKNEALDFNFDFATLNKNKDEEDIEVNIYQDSRLLGNYQLKDKKISTDNGETEALGNIKLLKEDLPEGVYKIEIKVNNDVITRKINTAQSKISFINKLWIYGNVDQIKLVTDSSYLSVETTNPGSLQEISFGSKKLKLNETFKLITAPDQAGIKEISFDKNDILLAGNGVFAASAQEILNPAFNNLSALSNPSEQGIKYILAKYDLVKKIGNNFQSTLDFDLQSAYQENNKYGFIISAPGLNINSGQNNGVILTGAEIQLTGDNIWSILKRYYNKLIKNEQI